MLHERRLGGVDIVLAHGFASLDLRGFAAADLGFAAADLVFAAADLGFVPPGFGCSAAGLADVFRFGLAPAAGAGGSVDGPAAAAGGFAVINGLSIEV